jgi:trk system potassium uptake protein
MKIIILGAGQVGASVAEGLVSEENDITIVDQDGTRLAQLQDRLDLRTVVGDAATPSVLRSAGIRRRRHGDRRDPERPVQPGGLQTGA